MADELLIDDLGESPVSEELRARVIAEATLLGTVTCPVSATAFRLYECPVMGDDSPVLARQEKTRRVVVTNWHDPQDLADDLDVQLVRPE